jgi:hypothetical protein
MFRSCLCILALLVTVVGSACSPTAVPPAPTMLPPVTPTVAPSVATPVATPVGPVATAPATRVVLPTVTPVPTLPPTAAPAATRTPTPGPTALPTAVHKPLPTPGGPRPTPAGSQNNKNGVFDVLVLVDAKGPQVARPDIERVFEIAALNMGAKTGEWMRLVDVLYGLTRGASGGETAQLTALVDGYLSKNVTNPPDGILLFTDTETCRNAGGFSISAKPAFAYKAEYPSPRADIGSDKIYVAVVEYHHAYAQCGYDIPGSPIRVSAVSLGGECRNRAGVVCAPNGDRWTCPDMMHDLNSDPDFMTASIIIHEFLHPFGIDPEMNNDHFASTACVKRGGVTEAQANAVLTDLYESQYYHSLCPDVFPRFKRSQ